VLSEKGFKAFVALTSHQPQSLAINSGGQFGASVPGHQGPRPYAEEAAGWLPSTSAEYFINLSWDEEPVVRKTFERSAQERLDRKTASEFEIRVLSDSDPDGVKQNWLHGIGLSRVGDDTTIRRLTRRLEDRLPPSVRFWLKRVRKAVERRWNEVTRKWPEPWYADLHQSSDSNDAS